MFSADFISDSRDFTQHLTSGELILIHSADACILVKIARACSEKLFRTYLRLISFPDLLWTKPKARSGQIRFALRDHLSGMSQGRQVRMPNINSEQQRPRSPRLLSHTTSLRQAYDMTQEYLLESRNFLEISYSLEISLLSRNQTNTKEVERFFSTTWLDLSSNTFATVGEFQ